MSRTPAISLFVCALNGHTITGGFIGIQCDRTCKLVGPGTITGSAFAGVQAYGTGVKMKHVNSTNHAYAGAQVWDSATIEGPAGLSGNGVALRVGNKAKLKNVTITGNGEFGIRAAGDSQCEKKSGATLVNSTITGNDTAPECGVSQVCPDVATCGKQPRVKPGSTCGTSYQIGSGNPGSTWGVCTLD